MTLTTLNSNLDANNELVNDANPQNSNQDLEFFYLKSFAATTVQSRG